MVGRRASATDEGSYLRKLRKPLIEKRRRERINSSIDTLKQILTQSRPERDGETKLDKAEILEMTVNRLSKDEIKPATYDSYSRGFQDCSRETIQFLATTGKLDSETLFHLQTHLRNLSNVPVSMTTRRPSPQRLCSTPVLDSAAFPGNVSIVTIPSMSPSFSLSFVSSSEDSCSTSSGSDFSILGNIIRDEKPWRPW